MDEQPINYQLLVSVWRTDLQRQHPYERGVIQSALEPRRVPYLMVLSFLVLTNWETFDTKEENVFGFASAALGIEKQKIFSITARKNRERQHLKLIVQFRVPFDLEKQSAFFSANLYRAFTSHTEDKQYLCRLQQPAIENYLSVQDYNVYMAGRYGL